MGFTVSQKTLEGLEWPVLLARWEEALRTPGARARLRAAGAGEPGAALFEADAGGVRQRLAETGEARAILAEGEAPPLGGAADLDAILGRAQRGGSLDGADLVRVAATLAALAGSARFLEARRQAAPSLAELAGGIEEHPALLAALEGSLDPATGEVRDAASTALAEARRDARRLAGEIQGRMEELLRDPGVRAGLSDVYSTLRADRFVLPVRADARGSVRGIVHDASRSGTTIFVEPEALVEPNNRHKRAELAILQETRRVLRDLSARVREAADAIAADLRVLERIDLAFGRARLADAWRAVAPEVGDEGVVDLPLLRHPLLPDDEAVGNDLRLGLGFHVLVLSGPNAGGKTVAMKSVALAVLLVRAGLFVPAAAPARVDVFDAVLTDIGDEQDIREHLSTFSAHMANLAAIVERADARTLVALDEVGVGTDPGEGAAIAQAALEALADAGARVVATTHLSLLKEMAEVDGRFANASVEFDPDTLAPTYRLRMGLPGSSSASAVAARMGLRADVLARAEELMAREDRRLDAMLSELSSSRASLEREQRTAERLRAEGEAVRDEYRARVEKLQARRDELFRSMRADLDRAFREAHEQVAGVVRDLQSGESSSQAAARAREELLALEARASEAQQTLAPAGPALPPVDWRRARPGDPVRIRDGGSATLVALPDRRGRVVVRTGSAKVVVPMDRIGAAQDAPAPRPAPRPPAPVSELVAGGESRCDVRGLRVDEALDRVGEVLDRAAAEGTERVAVVHGIGTGALRRAVREHLGRSPYVARFAPADQEEGGEGVTIAEIGR